MVMVMEMVMMDSNDNVQSVVAETKCSLINREKERERNYK
jgi:hypothetical protein